MPELCPGCARRDQDEDIGLCVPCHQKGLETNYAAADHEAVLEPRGRWKGWSESAGFANLRQQRHRLLKNTRPRELVDPGVDPLLLAAEALEHLRLVKRAVQSQSRALERIEQVAELVRQLAWGLRTRALAPPSA